MTSRNRPGKPASIAVLVALSILVLLSQPLAAQPRWIDATQSTDLGPIVSDEIRDRIYLADSAAQELVVIDSLTEAVAARLPLPGPVADLALTKDSATLGVVGGGFITRIDLATLAAQTRAVPAQVTGQTTSIAFDRSQRIYLGTGYQSFGWLWVLNPKGVKVLNSFGVGSNLTQPPYTPLLVTDSTGTLLHVGERGLSPLSMYKIDITRHKKPVFLAEDVHGSLGSNLRDVALSPRFDEVYLASGYPYGIQVVDASTMAFLSLLSTGPYPTATAVGPLGNRVFGVPGNTYNNVLYEFDAATRTERQTYALDSQVLNGRAWERGLAVDRFGEKAFVVHGNTQGGDWLKVQVIDLAAP